MLFCSGNMMRKRKVMKLYKNQMRSDTRVIGPETDSCNSKSGSGLKIWQREILTSRLGDYKADPAQGENWDSVITELSGRL